MQRAKLSVICKTYGIHLCRKKNAGYIFEFPHHSGYTECGDGNMCEKIAMEGLPRANTVHYAVEVPAEACTVATTLLDNGKKRRKSVD